MFKKFLVLFYVLLIISSCLSIFVSSAKAYYTNMPATQVLGQTNFTDSAGGVSSTKFFDNTTHQTNTGLAGIFVDPNGRLIVSDFSNARVLIWNRVPTTNGAPADLVLGQPDFISSTSNNGGRSASSMNAGGVEGVYSTGTKLFVADTGNNRILIWNTFPTTNGQAADVVVGQTDFASAATTCDNVTLRIPDVVFVYQDKLVVTDRNHARVMIWNSIPTTNGQTADLVIGKTNFSDCSTATVVTQSNLSNPFGLFVDNGKLFVTEANVNRVLIWNTFPTTNGQAADVVVGQTNFENSTTGTTISTLNNPNYVYIKDSRMFVSDEVNHRILIFNSIPTTNGASADLVLGQPSFTSGSANQGSSTAANTLNRPRAVFIYNNKLFVGDPINARVLIFPNIMDTPSMNITTPPETVNNTTLRVRGSIQLGNRPNYSMQWVKADINGGGLGYVTSLGGGRDNGDSQTLYDFMNEFNPTVNGGTTTNYTMKLVASSFNADTTSLFYFQPFNFEYIRRTNPTLSITKQNLNISFLVNKLNIQRMKDNIDHFEVLTSTDSGKLWNKLTTNISTDKINDQGNIYLTIPNTLTPGTKYLVKVVSVSKDSNWRQDSNSLTYFVPKKKTK